MRLCDRCIGAVIFLGRLFYIHSIAHRDLQFLAYCARSTYMKTCVIIPVYNHSEAIVHVIEALKPFGLSCYLVNDGSSAQCSAVLRRIAEQEKDGITLYERDRNGGKGAAVM